MGAANILQKAKALFRRRRPENPPQDAVGAEQMAEDVAPEAPEVAPKPPDQILIEAIDRQTSRIEDLLGEFRAAADVNRAIAESAQASSEARQRSQKTLEELLERAEEAVGEMRRLAENLESQGQWLQKIQGDLSASRNGGVQVGSAVTKLAESIQDLRNGNAAHIELMEKVRDQLGGADEELHNAVAAQGRKLNTMLIVVASLLAAIVLMRLWEFLR